MKIQILRKNVRPHQHTLGQRLQRGFETLIKSSILLSLPFLFTLPTLLLWYFVAFKYDLHFDEKMENIAVAAWIPILGILYCLLVAEIFRTVWGEYKEMRMSIKEYDLEKFMSLRDEELSPLCYILITVLSLILVASFMALKYPNVADGVLTIGTVSYILNLMFFMVREIDDPCCGVWFIKTIHPEWIEMDYKEYREEMWKMRRIEYKEHLKITGPAGTITEDKKVTVTEPAPAPHPAVPMIEPKLATTASGNGSSTH